MHQPVEELPDEPQIRFVRMKTGDDLITEVIRIKQDEQEYYLFINPLKVLYLVGEAPGRLMMSLIEWVFPRITKEQQFQIYPDDVITIADASDDITDYYFEALYKLEEKSKKVKLTDPMIDDPETAGKIMKDLFNQKDNSNEETPTEEEVEYIKKIIDDLKNGKRTLH